MARRKRGRAISAQKARTSGERPGEAAAVDDHEAVDELGSADREPRRGEAADRVAEHDRALGRELGDGLLGDVGESASR